MIKVTNTCTHACSSCIMYNKNGCGLSIGAWHVGVAIMVPETISKKLRPMYSPKLNFF